MGMLRDLMVPTPMVTSAAQIGVWVFFNPMLIKCTDRSQAWVWGHKWGVGWRL
jgi:hypothetical protein